VRATAELNLQGTVVVAAFPARGVPIQIQLSNSGEGARPYSRDVNRPSCATLSALSIDRGQFSSNRFFWLAILGMSWADDSWTVRLDGLRPVAKLLAMPFLFYHFQRSQRGHWALVAFLASCSVLLAVSFIAFFAPDLKIEATKFPGVPVRNYIDQSQEFAICIFALLVIVLTLMEKRRMALAIFCGGMALGFYLNMTFVALARTAVLYAPVLEILFAAKYFTHEGWLYVLRVGIAGGLQLRGSHPPPKTQSLVV